MKYFIYFLIIWLFIKSFSYSIFEFKRNKKSGSIIILFSIISSILPFIALYLKGIY